MKKIIFVLFVFSSVVCGAQSLEGITVNLTLRAGDLFDENVYLKNNVRWNGR